MEDNKLTIGTPKASETFTVKELLKRHMVGVYINGEWKYNVYVEPPP